MQMSMWVDRRRSPRISALDAWKEAHQQTPFTPQNSMRVGLMENRASGSGDEKGPPSRTRVRTKRKLQDVGGSSVSTKPKQGKESPNREDHSTNCGQPLLLKAKESPKHDDHAACTVLSMPWMPEKRILELILDILQKRDTHEIFAEPVDPSEVEDYYEIIKEPMDFGTMRAKLHEGMYSSLEQFEHDVFSISRNAMHFNSSATIYFRQARAIQELAKKVFDALKNDPENFESEFSGTRRRSTRRPQGEAKVFKMCPGLATNVGSGSMTIDATSKEAQSSLGCPTNFRRSVRGNHSFPSTTTHVDTRDHFSGARDGRSSSYSEADRRCTYKPSESYNENDSIVSMIYNDPKPLVLVNQQDISYRESLMLFVKGLGPTAQMIAKRKLQGCWLDATSFLTPSSNSWVQAQKCQTPAAFLSTQRRPSTLDNLITDTSQKFLHQPPVCHPVLDTTSDVIDLTDADDREKACTGDRMSNHHCAPIGEITRNNDAPTIHDWVNVFGVSGREKAPTTHDRMNVFAVSGREKAPTTHDRMNVFAVSGREKAPTTNDQMNVFGVSGTEKVLQNQSTKIQLGSYSSTAGAGDFNSSPFGVSNTGNRLTTITVNEGKLDNQEWPMRSASNNLQSNLFEFKSRNNSSTSSSGPFNRREFPSLSQTNGFMHMGSQDQAVAAWEPNDGVSSSSQVGHFSESNQNQHDQPVSQFTFDLPFLKSRLNQMNLLGKDRSLQPSFQQGCGAEGSPFDQMRYKRVSNCTHRAEPSTQPFLNHQRWSTLDTTGTDLALQL
ncbi:uncharacterized protein LOC132286306 [Cornus florida]|uniref:uncharacterized protein LOC132286306 n=1 Tax=Cornus florida TaxID=4283 RepID=UPI00289D9158|nr:uncharacterized protein LOC132286306 [Cornus florida]